MIIGLGIMVASLGVLIFMLWRFPPHQEVEDLGEALDGLGTAVRARVELVLDRCNRALTRWLKRGKS